MEDSKAIRRAKLEDLKMSSGWKVVVDETESRMKSIMGKLVNTTFTDLKEVIALQAEYKTLKGIINQYELIK